MEEEHSLGFGILISQVFKYVSFNVSDFKFMVREAKKNILMDLVQPHQKPHPPPTVGQQVELILKKNFLKKMA